MGQNQGYVLFGNANTRVSDLQVNPAIAITLGLHRDGSAILSIIH